MACISVPTAILGAGALGTAGSVASGAIGSSAATSAANTQAKAAAQGQALQAEELQQIQANLAPFISGGQSAFSQLENLTGTSPTNPQFQNPLTAPLTARFQPTIQQLEGTPGYQFTLDQGLKATQNSFAGQGLAKSGAAMKGAANYAEGLAGTTYQQQFQNYLAQNQQIYNLLSGISTTGANAAAISGQQGISGTSNITNLLTGGAAAQAAGTVGSANALGGAVAGIGGAGQNTALLLALNQAGLFGNQTGAGGDFAGGV